MGMKAAVLGAGGMGKRHALSLAELGIPVVAVCDSNAQAIKNFRNETKNPNAAAYRDFDSFISGDDFDILFICLPPFAQDGQFERAAAAGKHIFIEKPIALNTGIGKRMVSAAKKAGITTMVGFHMRKGLAVQKICELIQSGKTGRPVLFNGQYRCNALHPPWWRNADLSGGQVFEQAIHVYDMCRCFFGNPKSVCCMMSNVCHSHICSYTVEDVSACIAAFSTGALASITANNCAVPDKWIGEVTVVFENLTAHIEDHNHAAITFTAGKTPIIEHIDSDIDPYFEEVKEFVECTGKGIRTSCDISEGYKSLCFVEASISSAHMDGKKHAVDIRC